MAPLSHEQLKTITPVVVRLFETNRVKVPLPLDEAAVFTRALIAPDQPDIWLNAATATPGMKLVATILSEAIEGLGN